jgi:hypothetical protein
MRYRVVGGGVWFGIVETVAEAGGFGGGPVDEGESEYEGVGVCMDGRWDRDVAGKWWER